MALHDAGCAHALPEVLLGIANRYTHGVNSKSAGRMKKCSARGQVLASAIIREEDTEDGAINHRFGY